MASPDPAVVNLRGAPGSRWNARLSLAGDRLQLRELAQFVPGEMERHFACSGKSLPTMQLAGGSTRGLSDWMFDGHCSLGGESVAIKANRNFLLIRAGEGSKMTTHILRLEPR